MGMAASDVIKNMVGGAASVAGDGLRLARLLRTAAGKARATSGPIEAVRDDALAMVRMLRAWRRRSYTGVPWRTVLIGVGALLYFVNPADLVPDALPAVGMVDDATVLGAVLAAIKSDIERFRRWEAEGRSGGDG